MPCPVVTASIRAWSSEGGPVSVQACHRRLRVTAGVSQDRMARNALGQQGGWDWWDGAGPPLRPVVGAGVRRCDIQGSGWGEPLVPAEGEGAVGQGLVAADGAVGADLEVGPAEFVLDLLVALLDPRPQSVEADDLGEVGRRVPSVLGLMEQREARARQDLESWTEVLEQAHAEVDAARERLKAAYRQRQPRLPQPRRVRDHARSLTTTPMVSVKAEQAREEGFVPPGQQLRRQRPAPSPFY